MRASCWLGSKPSARAAERTTPPGIRWRCGRSNHAGLTRRHPASPCRRAWPASPARIGPNETEQTIRAVQTTTRAVRARKRAAQARTSGAHSAVSVLWCDQAHPWADAAPPVKVRRAAVRSASAAPLASHASGWTGFASDTDQPSATSPASDGCRQARPSRALLPAPRCGWARHAGACAAPCSETCPATPRSCPA